MSGSALDRIPGGYQLYAALLAIASRLRLEWRASPIHHLLLSGPRPDGLAAAPKNFRPADPDAGRRILAGAFVFAGETLTIGPRSDPWDRPTPNRRFAVALHSFDWLRDLTVHGDPGAWEGLRLFLAWRRFYGRWNAFSWRPDILERRVFNLACAVHALSAPASEVEAEMIAGDLAHQARFLLGVREGPARAAERAAAAAVAGAALGGVAGDQLLDRALSCLSPALLETVGPDGGHASRNPQAAFELYLDLSTLDEVLTQRGVVAPEELTRALDRLCATVRFFTLADGRLAAFQGGSAAPATHVAAPNAGDAAHVSQPPASRNGYHRLAGRSLQVFADAAAPAAGPWSQEACAQPLAIEVLAGSKRLIVNSGWTADASGPAALRLVDAASTTAVAEAACGAPLSGFAAKVLGLRLRDCYAVTEVQRHEEKEALWLEMAHDGWNERFGLRHARRLYLDVEADELRGEDCLTPFDARSGATGRRFVPFVVRFHLHPQVSALIARDRKSVLLKFEGEEQGWWLRNDALEVALEPSIHHQDGQARHAQQIVLRGQARLDAGAKVRWKLSSAAHDRPEVSRVDAKRLSA